MQVQAVNTQNNQTSFGAIFYPKNIKFNKVQEPIADAIKQAMREPLQKFKGETAEGFYKSKGLDFGIAPHSNESVHLTAYKGIKEKGTGVDRRYTYSSSIYIGEYDKNSDFRVSDIETGINKHKKENIELLLNSILELLLVPMFGLLLYIGYNADKSLQNEKQLIENVDSVASKAKSVLPDTTAVKTKVLKTIKK